MGGHQLFKELVFLRQQLDFLKLQYQIPEHILAGMPSHGHMMELSSATDVDWIALVEVMSDPAGKGVFWSKAQQSRATSTRCLLCLFLFALL